MNRDFFFQDSEEIDSKLGFKINEIETKLLLEARELRPHGTMANLGEVFHKGHQTWIGLDPQVLNTPYSELVEMCEILNPKEGQLLVDLGASYGRLGIVLDRLFSGTHFLGYELVEERVAEGNRIFKTLKVGDSQLIQQDLTDPEFSIPNADCYFIYDFGKVDHIRHTLLQLEKKTSHHHFRVIARGKGVRSLIDHEHPWLSSLNEVIHKTNYSVYSF